MDVSKVLENYVAGLNSGKADQVASLFAEECSFVDGGARLLKFPDVVASGREGVKNAFEGVFKTYSVEAKIVKLNPNSMEYDVELAGLHIPCRRRTHHGIHREAEIRGYPLFQKPADHADSLESLSKQPKDCNFLGCFSDSENTNVQSRIDLLKTQDIV